MEMSRYDKVVKHINEDFIFTYNVDVEKHYKIYRDIENVVGRSSLSVFIPTKKESVTSILNEYLDSISPIDDTTNAISVSLTLTDKQAKLLFIILWSKAIENVNASSPDVYLSDDKFLAFTITLSIYNKEKMKYMGTKIF